MPTPVARCTSVVCRLRLSVTVAVALLLAACGGAPPVVTVPATASPTERATAVTGRGAGDTLRLFYWQAPTTLNPHRSPGTKDLSASRIAYEPLASYDKDGRLLPFLAAEIPALDNGGVAPDGRSVTWKLKQGIRWSDGHPFTADDVLFTYEYVSNPAVRATSTATYDAVKDVEVIDPHTIRVHFKDVNPAWSLPFVGSQGMIIPRHVFAAYAGANADAAPANLVPVGTGPYRGSDFKREDVLIIGSDVVNSIKIIYEPNPYFREADKPYFRRVELLGGGGDVVFAARAVLGGQVDFAWNLTVTDDVVAQIEAGGQATVVNSFDAFTERIMINFADPNRQTADGERASAQFAHPFLGDLRVRQALAHAVDRQAIARAYGRGGRATSNLLVSPASYHSTTSRAYAFDLQRAATLLDEAGWTDSNGDGIRDKGGVKLRVVFQTSIQPLRQLAQETVREALESIGVEVELKNIDASVFLGPVESSTNTRRHFYADLEEFAFSNKSPDPGAYMKGWTCDEIAGKANNWSLSNWGRYCNPAYDALYRQSTTEMDPAKRRQLFIRMNDLLIEDVALIPLVHLATPAGASATLTGLDPTPWDVEVWNIKDWRRK